MGLFGNSQEDYFGSQDYKDISLGNLGYKSSGTYNPYSSSLMGDYETVTKQMLSGKLTPEQQALMDKSFGNYLKTSREGSYGMPIGAQQDIQARAGADMALEGLVKGQEMQTAGLNAAMPFMQFGANENYKAYGSRVDENRYGQNYNMDLRNTMAGYDSSAKKAAAESGLNLGGFLQSAVEAGTEFGLSELFPANIAKIPGVSNYSSTPQTVAGKATKQYVKIR